MPSPTECDADISGSSPTTPQPELLMVAEKLKGKIPNTQQVPNSVIQEVITPEVVILDVTLPQSVIQEGREVSTKITNVHTNSDYDAPEETFSASSFGSHSDQATTNERIRTIAQETQNVSKFEFEVFEPQPPGRSVSSIFIVMYSFLGLTILTLIILTVLFDIGMLLLLVMIVIIFIIIVILTNFCVMMYTF